MLDAEDKALEVGLAFLHNAILSPKIFDDADLASALRIHEKVGVLLRSVVQAETSLRALTVDADFQ